MFITMSEVIQLSRQNGYTFFNKDRQMQMQTIVHPTIYHGRYFITEDVYNNKTTYSIYKVLKDGACDIVQANIFPSFSQAKRYINMFLDSEEEETEEYFNG